MAAAFIAGYKVVADKSVHAPPSPSSVEKINHFLPIIKGEVVTVMKVVDSVLLCVENRYCIQGLVCAHHVRPIDIYSHENFFLYDFTSKMAERILSKKLKGTFLIRSNSRDSDKVVISMKISTVMHYSFAKKGGGIEYNGVTYQSIPSFINKCSNETVLDCRLGKWVMQSDLNLPSISTGNIVTLPTIQMRIVGRNVFS